VLQNIPPDARRGLMGRFRFADDGQPADERSGEIVAEALREAGVPEKRWRDERITKLWKRWIAGETEREEFVSGASKLASEFQSRA
jgi:hypothetical protein